MKEIYFKYKNMSENKKLSVDELACIEQIKSSQEKERFFDWQKCKITTWVKAALLSLWIAIWSVWSANSKEVTNYSQFEQLWLTQTIPTKEIPADLRQWVIQVQESYVKAVNEWKITFPMRIDTVWSSASEIANDLSLAPRQTLEEVLGTKDKYFIAYNNNWKWTVDPKEIDENNFEFSKVWYKWDLYKHILEKLFDTTDVEKWLRSWYEKKELTPEEIKKYKDEMALTKKRWEEKIWSMISSVKKWTMSADVFYEGQELFIKWVESLSIEPSREAYRRLFVNAMTIAFWENVKDKDNVPDMVKKELIANIWEYMQLTNKDFEMLRLWFWEVWWYVLVEYRIPSSEDLKKSKELWEYPYLQELSKEWLSLFVDEQKFESELEVLESSYQLAQSKEELAQSKQLWILLDELKEQRQELIDLFKNYQETWNVDLIPKIEKWIKNLRNIESNFENLFLEYKVKKEDMNIVKLRISELYDAYKKILW